MNIACLSNTLHLLRAEEIVDFDLSDLVIDGRKVFEMGVVPRDEMPQLKGFPRKGSVASLLERDRNGKVNVSEEFAAYMKDVLGIDSMLTRIEASNLKGAQSELVASKVANTVSKLGRNQEHKKFHQTYFADKQGALLDGHHGWASVRIYDILQGTGWETRLIVRQFDCTAGQLLDAAREFTAAIGIETKAGV